jgi:hypothetical protein
MMAWHAATLEANAMKLARRTFLRLTAGAAALPPNYLASIGRAFNPAKNL